MRFDVLTLFPELFDPFMKVGVTRRAYATRQVDVRLWPLRDFADDNYRRVDDRPYGGGPGMVMLVEPLERALAALRADRAEPEGAQAPVILFSPAGAPLTQARVQRLAASPGAVLLCGRYEGIDQRVVEVLGAEELSVGDFVLSGGEIAALAVVEAVARLLPGVLGDGESTVEESHESGLVEYPQYTRPPEFRGRAVPEVLLSGDHGRIRDWRRASAVERTRRRDEAEGRGAERPGTEQEQRTAQEEGP